MKKGLLILCFIMIFTDAFSQRIPFGFWNRGERDTVLLAVPELKSPSDSAVGVDQSPNLNWDGVIYATRYVVQLSPDTGFSTITWEHDTSSSRAGVTLGLARGSQWYWRVLAYNAFDTSDWSEAWTFTVTTGPALTAPVLKLPTDGATGQIQSPTLVWDAVINADNYVIELSDSTDFSSPYWIKNTENTSAIIDSVLDYSSTWYWRATAYNDFDTSEASDTFSFTVISSPITAPTLLTPTNGATGQTQSPTLVWSRVDSAGFYSVQISQSEIFSTVTWTANTFDTMKTVITTLEQGTKWYWRVRAMNSDTSAWSDVYSFAVTEGAPTARAYYIDATSGADEYSGRATDKAWKTLDKVSNFSFIPGDTILLKGGETFSGKIRHTFTHNDTTQAIIYKSYGTGKAEILLGSTDTTGIKITLTNHAKIEISNIKITGIYNPLTQTGGSNVQHGIWVNTINPISPLGDNAISQVNINHCEISYLKNSGIRIVPGDYGRTLTCHIDSNLIHNLGVGAGIYMVYNWLSNSRIYANTIYDIYGRSDNIYGWAIATDLCKDVTIERNLIYNIGENASWSGLGITAGACKNIYVRYNEIYNIISNTHQDAEAIDFEIGTDSSLAEYNYIHDTQGIGMLISGGTSYNSITTNYLTYATERGSIDSGASDYNTFRYNLIKNWANTSTTGFHAINFAPTFRYNGVDTVRGTTNQVYNNTMVFTNPRKAAGNVALLLGGTDDSSKIFNNLIVVDSVSLVWHRDTSYLRHSFVQNNMYWDRGHRDLWYNTGTTQTFQNIRAWSNSTKYDTTAYRYNPLLYNAYNTVGDTLNNPFLIESALGKYIPSPASLTIENGVEITDYVHGAPLTDIRGMPSTSNGKYSIGAFMDTSTAGYTFQEETKRWIGRSDTVQTYAQTLTKDSLILFLKQDTLLSKLDLFYVFANLDRQSAKLNVLKDTFNITAFNTPTFTTQQGYTGNGTSTYLNTFWTPSTNGVNFSLDSASMSVYSMTSVQEGGYFLGAVSNSSTRFSHLNAWTLTGNIDARINTSTGTSSIPVATSIGLFTESRISSSTIQVFRNDSMYFNGSSTSSGLPTVPIYILARDNNFGLDGHTTKQISMVATGTKLSLNNQRKLTDDFEWYLNRTGTNKVPIRPLITYPANADTGISLTTQLRWEKLNNAETYDIKVSYTSDFASLVGEMVGIDTNVYFVGGTNSGTGSVTLVNDQTHYWKVKGRNSADTGSWSQTYSFTTPTTYDAESIALFARFPLAIGTARKDLIDSLIKQLKADTVWSNLDLFYMLAAQDTGQANTNWKSSSYYLIRTGSPTFTADQGYTGNGISAYLKTNWSPLTHHVNYTLNSGSISAYCRDNITEANYIYGCVNAGSVDFIQFNPRSAINNLDARINQTTSYVNSNSDARGIFIMNRSGSANVEIYRNGTLLVSPTNTSTVLPTPPLTILARNNNFGMDRFSSRQVSFVMVGGSFSSYTQNIINRRIEWYLNRVGAFVSVPSIPTLLVPTDAATGVSDTPDLDWDNVGADYYQIEIDDFIAFSTPEVSEDVYGSEFLSVIDPLLTANTTYYWRVRGVNANGTGAWSTTFSFTTAP